MMGLRFNSHPDLRRILMWDGYPYFPLRKEFPLEGLPSDMPDVAFTSAAPMEGGPSSPSPAPRRRKIASHALAGRFFEVRVRPKEGRKTLRSPRFRSRALRRGSAKPDGARRPSW